MKKLLFLLTLCTSIAIGQTFNGEKKAAKDAAVAFLKWYITGYKGFDKYELYSSVKPKKEGPPYVINWKNVEKHFAWIKAKAPLFATSFIKNEKLFFEYCDKAFKENPEEEMTPGFDYDRILGSQEGVDVTIKEGWFKKGKIWKVKLIGSTQAEVAIIDKALGNDGSSNKFLMVKENGQWKVALPPGMFGVAPFEKEINK